MQRHYLGYPLTLGIGIAIGIVAWNIRPAPEHGPWEDWQPVFSLKDCMIKGMHGQREVMFPIILADCREQAAAIPVANH